MLRCDRSTYHSESLEALKGQSYEKGRSYESKFSEDDHDPEEEDDHGALVDLFCG